MKRLEIFGATPSPYTQKMLTLLRYKRIPYNIHWGDTRGRLESLNLELPKPVLLPVILFENEDKELAATTDSTPMIKRLELSLIHISEPTRPLYISYAVFCLKKKRGISCI